MKKQIKNIIEMLPSFTKHLIILYTHRIFLCRYIRISILNRINNIKYISAEILTVFV